MQLVAVDEKKISTEGRVLTVTPREDGTFSVLAGQKPELYWFVSKDPIKLGAKLALRGTVAKVHEMPDGSVTVLDGVNLEVDQSAYVSRPVDPKWTEAVQKAMSRPLFHYQRDGAAWLAQQLSQGHGAILCDDPGLGKTTQSIAAIAALELWPVIVVCPTTLKFNWAREFEWSRIQPVVSIVESTRKVNLNADVIIINYDIIKQLEIALAEVGAKAIVFDEAHLLKEPLPSTTHRAAIATRLAHYIRRSILLTGTPIMNRPHEMWRLLHIAHKQEWPSYEAFCDRYCKAQEDPTKSRKRIVTSAGRGERLDELQARTSEILWRRTKAEVKADIPLKRKNTIRVHLDPYDLKHYKKIEKDVVLWLKQQGKLTTAAEQAKALVQLTELRKIASLGKLRTAIPNYLKSWFRHERRPLVIFGYHRMVVSGVTSICTDMGLHVSELDTNSSQEKRQEAVDSFQHGDADVFVAPITAAGVGINLYRSSDVLFVERTWTPSQMEQAECRVHRIGQDREVSITYMDAKNTIDEYVARTLDSKSVLISKIVDDYDWVSEFVIKEMVENSL